MEAFFVKLEKEKKRNTVLSYRRDLEALSGYVSPCLLREARSEQLIRYFRLQSKRMSSSSFARALCVARKYFVFLKEVQIRSDNPMDGIRMRDFSPQKERLLEERDFETLLQSSFTGVRGRRDLAMVTLLCETGMKVSELVELDREDLFLEEGFLICGRDRRRRKIPLSKSAVKILREALLLSQIQSASEKAVFLGSTGKRMTRQGFWKNLKERATYCGIENCTPQILRHSLARILLGDGKTKEEVRCLLGNQGDAALREYEKREKGKKAWDC